MDKSGRARLIHRRGWFLAIANRLEHRFHFPIDRKAASLRLGEDQAVVHEHIELAGFAGRDFGRFAEAPFE